jgi:hypothetical protein
MFFEILEKQIPEAGKTSGIQKNNKVGNDVNILLITTSPN